MHFYALCLLAIASVSAQDISTPTSILNKRGLIDYWREKRHQRRLNRERRYAELHAPIPVSQTKQVITTVDGPGGPVVVGGGPAPVIGGPPTLFKRGWIENWRERRHQRKLARMRRYAERHAPIPVSQTQQVVTKVDGAPTLFKRNWWNRVKGDYVQEQ